MINPLVLDSKRKEEGVSPSSSRLRLYPCFLAHPVSFPFRVSPQHPLVSSLVSRGNSVEISWFGPKISQSGKIPGYTWKLPCDRLGILPISSVSPQILPQTSSQTQGNSRVARMEHQTPSGFPGNFRKRKVLGTLSFPFWFPETWVQANVLVGRMSSPVIQTAHGADCQR